MLQTEEKTLEGAIIDKCEQFFEKASDQEKLTAAVLVNLTQQARREGANVEFESRVGELVIQCENAALKQFEGDTCPMMAGFLTGTLLERFSN